MKTTTAEVKSPQRTKLIKRYHVLAGQAGFDQNAKDAIMASYGAESSTELNLAELQDVVSVLEHIVMPKMNDLEKWQKWTREMVKSYGKACGANYTDEYAEGIICKATGAKAYSAISKNRLIGIYNQFKKSVADARATKEIIVEDVKAMVGMN